MSTYYVENFGCRATQADGAAIERQFQERGLVRAQSSSQARLVVLNTCTVTASADQDARAAIRRVHRENPECQIIVTGCYAQRDPEEIAAIPGVRQVIGNSHKHRVAELSLRLDVFNGVADASSGSADHKPDASPPGYKSFVPLSAITATNPQTSGSIFVSDIFAHTELLAAPVFHAANARTRPHLKVQDGCNNRCTFCVIPSVRGRSRSLPLRTAIEEVNRLVAAGYREVVISGINLGRWGRDLVQTVPTGFVELVRAVLAETDLEKLRISSVEPMDWTDDLISLVANSSRIAKHAHVPMQSGSDRVLRAMHRKYRPWHYRQKIAKIHAAMPTAAIGADIMTGFPGETTVEFEETRSLVEDLPFNYLHVFTYSSRPGTPSAGLPNQIDVALARERNQILRELSASKKRVFMQSFLGERVEAITLKRREDETTEALTNNYLKLNLAGHHLPNRWVYARVNEVTESALAGSIA